MAGRLVPEGGYGWRRTTNAVGLAELLRASRLGYDALRVTGAAYLIVLGVQSLRMPDRGEDAAALVPDLRHWLGLRALTSGVLTSLLNPSGALKAS